MGCYVKIQTSCFLAKLESWVWKSKRKYNHGIFKNCSRIVKSTVANNILPLSYLFHIAKKHLYFDTLVNFQ